MSHNKETIASIKKLLNSKPTADELVRWRQDQRIGVQKLLMQYDKQQEKKQHQQQAFEKRLIFEKQAWQQGAHLAGVDEVGRGPLAGPVVAAAVVIDESFDMTIVHDSKQLTEKTRLKLDQELREKVVDFAFGIVDAEQIDSLNIYEASRIAMRQAIEALHVPIDGLLIDAMTVDLPLPQEKLIKGDDRSISIGAASILAKNYRDALMKEFAVQYPGYGFEHNAGYGTAEHLAGLAKLGVTPIHRKTFSPVKKHLK
ncbi:ribonuclease HII [Weissella paramesenteroides]|nr:ribonuclease HII [Weissella paramesenteroides]KAA8438676.1 ribonuclease HII [Weissella paramesenteroides]